MSDPKANRAIPKKNLGSDVDPLGLMKSLSRKRNGENESGSSNGGNHSDNSALVSLGNTSFGFNFDSEESNSTHNNSENNDNSEDSDAVGDSKIKAVGSGKNSGSNSSSGQQHNGAKMSTVSSLTTSSSQHLNRSDRDAADAAVANLRNIANSFAMTTADIGKPKARSDNDSGGYNSDTDDDMSSNKSATRVTSSSSITRSRDMKGRKKRKLDDKKREERNAREKERSFRISKQINELRALLSNGGIIVPKGTKSSVLTEAANYIRMLQQHQYRSEIDRHQLIQQMQMIGTGAHGPQAASAIRHVAAQNGVWSLGNFGGVPPKSAMSFYQPGSEDGSGEQSSSQEQPLQPNKVETPEYRFVFNSCGVGMAIASMGGAFLDCNQLFTQLSNYTKQELCSLTIFNLTAREDLQHAFDLISQMISPPLDDRGHDLPKPIVLRGAMKDRIDLGLSISLVKGDDGIAKNFCVTLIKNPTSPFDSSKPVPASFESVLSQQAEFSSTGKAKDTSGGGMNSAPAFTTG